MEVAFFVFCVFLVFALFVGFWAFLCFFVFCCVCCLFCFVFFFASLRSLFVLFCLFSCFYVPLLLCFLVYSLLQLTLHLDLLGDLYSDAKFDALFVCTLLLDLLSRIILPHSNCFSHDWDLSTRHEACRMQKKLTQSDTINLVKQYAGCFSRFLPSTVAAQVPIHSHWYVEAEAVQGWKVLAQSDWLRS